MSGMTLLLLERPGTALGNASQEAVDLELLNWSALHSDGKCRWGQALGLIALVGVLEEFTFLTLHREQEVDPTQRFFQCTGGGPEVDGRLLVEIGSENDVAIVDQWDAVFGRRDKLGLLPREELLPISFNWIMHGKLSSRYRLTPVPTFSMPAVNR